MCRTTLHQQRHLTLVVGLPKKWLGKMIFLAEIVFVYQIGGCSHPLETSWNPCEKSIVYHLGIIQCLRPPTRYIRYSIGLFCWDVEFWRAKSSIQIGGRKPRNWSYDDPMVCPSHSFVPPLFRNTPWAQQHGIIFVAFEAFSELQNIWPFFCTS